MQGKAKAKRLLLAGLGKARTCAWMPFAKRWALRSNAFVGPKGVFVRRGAARGSARGSPFGMSRKRWPKGHSRELSIHGHRHQSNGSKPVDVERVTIRSSQACFHRSTRGSGAV